MLWPLTAWTCKAGCATSKMALAWDGAMIAQPCRAAYAGRGNGHLRRRFGEPSAERGSAARAAATEGFDTRAGRKHSKRLMGACACTAKCKAGPRLRPAGASSPLGEVKPILACVPKRGTALSAEV